MQILSFKRSSHFEKGHNMKWSTWSSSLPLMCVAFFSILATPLVFHWVTHSDLSSASLYYLPLGQQSVLPAPQSPLGLLPVCIQSRFILCTSLIAVIDTSCVFSPNSRAWANLGIYRQGSEDRECKACKLQSTAKYFFKYHEIHPQTFSRHYFCSWKCWLTFMSAAYIQVHFRQDFFMEAEDCFKGSSLILVHIVCNIGHLRT